MIATGSDPAEKVLLSSSLRGKFLRKNLLLFFKDWCWELMPASEEIKSQEMARVVLREKQGPVLSETEW